MAEVLNHFIPQNASIFLQQDNLPVMKLWQIKQAQKVFYLDLILNMFNLYKPESWS